LVRSGDLRTPSTLDQIQIGALQRLRRTLINFWYANLRLAQTAWDANFVVAMRLMRLASGGALAQREAQRMIAEKAVAFGEAQVAAAAKLITGAGMPTAAKSASDVYRRKVGANRRRLKGR
jgi:hypothetical protein